MRGQDGGGEVAAPPTPPPFLGAKFFFHIKLGNIKFLHVNVN